MANPSVQKREKEKLRQERARDKESKRKERRLDKGTREPGEEGIDPDIAGIVPGPQPIAEDEP